MKKILIALLITAVVGGTFIFTNHHDKQNRQAFLEKYHLQDLAMEELIEYLDSSSPKPYQLSAQLSSQKLDLGDGENEFTFDANTDLFYLSFAPYEYETHPCFDHVPTGCQGEMSNSEFDVLVKDNKGNILYEGTERTALNGFAGIWLPRNTKGTIEVTYGDKTAISDFGTGSKDGTCLTTLNLI